VRAELTVDAVLESMDRIIAFVDAALDSLQCPQKIRRQIDVAVDELAGNIIHYAYADGAGTMTVCMEYDALSSVMSIILMDRGIPFNPLQRAEPDITAQVDERKVGGLGIMIARKSMDDISYVYRDGQNVLKIQKRIKKKLAQVDRGRKMV